MKHLQQLALIAVATAVTVFAGASTASATTLEVAGVAKNESIAIKASLKSGTTALLQDTTGALANTCTASTAEGSTASPFTGTSVSGPLSSLSFSSCTNEKVVVDKAGSLSVEWIEGTTNGTLRSSGAEVTVPTGPFGTVNCKTASTDLGTLTGVASGNAVVEINAVLNCGFFLPSARWEATYLLTSPEGLGVTS